MWATEDVRFKGAQARGLTGPHRVDGGPGRRGDLLRTLWNSGPCDWTAPPTVLSYQVLNLGASSGVLVGWGKEGSK